MKYSVSKDYNHLIRRVLKTKRWVYESKTGKHASLYCKQYNARIPVPSSPSDYRGVRNFRSSLLNLDPELRTIL